ncbi:MAG: ribonuclease BN [Gammaproteobacteria bacterium]|nr:ribonuclease BN [Gammaproteobacteria bacterium]
MAINFAPLQTNLNKFRTVLRSFLWQQDIASLPFAKRFLIRSCQILIAVIRDLVHGQLSLRAMSLVFTTLIGLFPLLALSFAILKSLGVHNTLEPTLLMLLEPLGNRSTEVSGQILGYVDDIQVQLISVTSVGLLLYIVLDMMRKIESSFNYIWAVKQGRSWSSRVSEYLLAVIVSPILLFLSISISSSVNTNFFASFLANLSFGGLLIELMALIMPILLMSLAFAFAYSFLPNTRVRFGSALLGGFVTTIIWKLMGSLFQSIFVASARESIYLAFATAIAVMLFAYIGWLVALIGSSIAFYHQNPAKARTGREPTVQSIAQQEQLSLTLASIIIRRFHQAKTALTESELAFAISSNPIVIEDSLLALEQIGLIGKTADDPVRYQPAHSIIDCALVDIWRALRLRNADQLGAHIESDEARSIKNFQSGVDAVIEKELGKQKFIDANNWGTSIAGEKG